MVRGAYLWSLASQIPVEMGNCGSRNSSTPLLDALCEGCGGDWERVWILGNITGFTLKVGSATGRIKWLSLTNETIVEAPIVYARIPGYPGSGNFTMRPRGTAGKTVTADTW